MALLIDIEGIDGSGKGTQAKRLCDRLVQAGVSAGLLSFPRYEQTLFGRAIGEFLNGRFGTLEQVHPFLVSLLFAGDRFESKTFLLESLSASQVVVLDRYVPSNVAHQAAKVDGPERADLARRILELEYSVYGLPEPDLILLLDLPVEAACRLIAQKSARSYTARPADLQEADTGYLSRVRDLYLELAASGSNWQVVPVCEDLSANDTHVRSIEEIADQVWSIVTRYLPSV